MKKAMALAVLSTIACLNFSGGVHAAVIYTCVEPNCDSANSSGSRYSKSMVTYKRAAKEKSGTAHQKTLGGESLTGTLAGSWDDVAAVVTFPWLAQAEQSLHLVALGLPAQALGNDQYSAAGWQRELFFLDFGDGVPRLLSSILLDADFTPQAGDVIDQPGQLWYSQYALYQEAEELAGDADFYSGYAEGAAVADIRFVTNDAGEVLQVAIDIYDDAGNYQYSVEPQAGDRMNPSFLAYDLEQADILYAMFYFEEPQAITEAISLERTYYVPNSNIDSALPQGFDSADLDVAVIFEGVKTVDGESSFAYSAPQSLGYSWGKAQQSSNTGGGSSGVLTPWLLILLSGLGLQRRRKQFSRR